MARGKTFSITVPERIVEHYDRKAAELDISRSKVVLNILLNDWQSLHPDVMDIACKHYKAGYCDWYEDECNTDRTNPKSCPQYSDKD